jgi:predicted DCC family thiol-disulfide oxidoreductase YuxK
MIIFFDGNCPLCLKEMCSLKRHDKHNSIELVDVHDSVAMSRFPRIDKNLALNKLHAIDGEQLLLGLDVTVKAWQLVGKHRWLRLSRLPICKPLSDAAYLLFAKHRMKISALFFKNACPNNTCAKPKP